MPQLPHTLMVSSFKSFWAEALFEKQIKLNNTAKIDNTFMMVIF
jgi:hypothetical protein